MALDIFGLRAKAELEALRASSARLDEARAQEIQRLGSLLQSTIMKLLALTSKDAFRTVAASEAPVQEQQPFKASPFMRRTTLSSALKQSREAANESSVSN